MIGPPESVRPAETSPTEEQHAQPDEVLNLPSQAEPSKFQGNSDDLVELQLMHKRLNECLDHYERIQNGGANIEFEVASLRDDEMWGATKWIVRYVDYTSKYGLGFLLNDGR